MTHIQALAQWLADFTPLQPYCTQGIAVVPLATRQGVALADEGPISTQTDISERCTVVQQYALWLRSAIFTNEERLSIHALGESLEAYCRAACTAQQLPQLASGYTAQEISCNTTKCAQTDDSGLTVWRFTLLLEFTQERTT